MIPPRRALLLIAHGSRRPEANADLDYLAEAMRARNEYEIIRTAYLELTPPTIVEGGTSCAEAGADRVVMLPLLPVARRPCPRRFDRGPRRIALEVPGRHVRISRTARTPPDAVRRGLPASTRGRGINRKSRKRERRGFCPITHTSGSWNKTLSLTLERVTYTTPRPSSSIGYTASSMPPGQSGRAWHPALNRRR